MASVMPDLQLPFQPWDIDALQLALNYTAWWQRHMCEQLAQGGMAGSRTHDLESQANTL